MLSKKYLRYIGLEVSAINLLHTVVTGLYFLSISNFLECIIMLQNKVNIMPWKEMCVRHITNKTTIYYYKWTLILSYIITNNYEIYSR